jgi:pimeloyl-ACP methyl ester carboxylesterase
MFSQPFRNRHPIAAVAGLSSGFVALLVISALVRADEVAGSAPFPGQRSTWNGYDRFDFEVDGKPVLVVAPKQAAPGRPWVWHGEFFGHKPAPDIALLGKGFHIVYMRVPDMLGCPQAVSHWNAFYRELTGKYGFAKKVALVGLSRGGLYCYNWAAANPEKVACIYGDAPVCDFKSWPGGKGKGKGSERDWKLVLQCYGFKSEAEALAYDKNPVDNLEPLAKAKVPLLHVYGDADDVVPWEENTGLVAKRYRKLGGQITLIAKKGVGHHPHGLDDPTPIVEFIARHAVVSPQAPASPEGAALLDSSDQAARAGGRFLRRRLWFHRAVQLRPDVHRPAPGETDRRGGDGGCAQLLHPHAFCPRGPHHAHQRGPTVQPPLGRDQLSDLQEPAVRPALFSRPIPPGHAAAPRSVPDPGRQAGRASR